METAQILTYGAVGLLVAAITTLTLRTVIENVRGALRSACVHVLHAPPSFFERVYLWAGRMSRLHGAESGADHAELIQIHRAIQAALLRQVLMFCLSLLLVLLPSVVFLLMIPFPWHVVVILGAFGWHAYYQCASTDEGRAAVTKRLIRQDRARDLASETPVPADDGATRELAEYLGAQDDEADVSPAGRVTRLVKASGDRARRFGIATKRQVVQTIERFRDDLEILGGAEIDRAFLDYLDKRYGELAKDRQLEFTRADILGHRTGWIRSPISIWRASLAVASDEAPNSTDLDVLNARHAGAELEELEGIESDRTWRAIESEIRECVQSRAWGRRAERRTRTRTRWAVLESREDGVVGGVELMDVDEAETGIGGWVPEKEWHHFLGWCRHGRTRPPFRPIDNAQSRARAQDWTWVYAVPEGRRRLVAWRARGYRIGVINLGATTLLPPDLGQGEATGTPVA